MKNKSNRHVRMVVNVLLTVVVLFEITYCFGYGNMKKNSMEYGLEYEKSPLVLQKAVLTNRKDLNEAYGIEEGKTLYELRLIYQNPSPCNGHFLGYPELEAGGGAYATYVYPKAAGYFGRQIRYSQVIPAKKTGCFDCFVAVPDNSGRLQVFEKEKKLLQKGEMVMFQLPQKLRQSVVWEKQPSTGE